MNYLLKSSKLIEVPEYLLKLLKNSKNQDALEVGVGNLRKSIKLSELFKSYTGLEPELKFYNRSKEICKIHNCKIKLVNSTIEEFKTKKKFDVILFFNVFHFVDTKIIMNILLKLLKPKGKIIVSEPKPIPRNWGSSELNQDSPDFNPKFWNRKKNILLFIKDFLIKNDFGYINMKTRNLFILKR